MVLGIQIWSGITISQPKITEFSVAVTYYSPEDLY